VFFPFSNVNKSNIVKYTILALFLTAFAVMFHQYITFGSWWSWEQFLHHENFSAVIVSLGIGLFIGFSVKKR
jgi:hypothetical protein